MTPKKCMSMAKSLTNTQHMELEPLCTDQNPRSIEKGNLNFSVTFHDFRLNGEN